MRTNPWADRLSTMNVFSLKRAIRLACVVLEGIAVVGLFAEFSGYLFRIPLGETVWLVFLRFVALSILALFLLQVFSLFIKWRRALFGLARAAVYISLAILPLSRLP